VSRKKASQNIQTRNKISEQLADMPQFPKFAR